MNVETSLVQMKGLLPAKYSALVDFRPLYLRHLECHSGGTDKVFEVSFITDETP